MTEIVRSLRRIARDLDGAGMRWALVGGLAVSVRAEPRTTRDIDVAVAVRSDSEAEGCTVRLTERGYVPLVALEQTSRARLATVRFAMPGSLARGAVLDLLFASSGIEQEIVASAPEEVLVRGLTARVATRSHLLALKVLSHDEETRPQDAWDIVSLLSGATDQEVEEVRAALRLIRKRGFHRNRPLQADFRAFLRRRGP